MLEPNTFDYRDSNKRWLDTWVYTYRVSVINPGFVVETLDYMFMSTNKSYIHIIGEFRQARKDDVVESNVILNKIYASLAKVEDYLQWHL